MDKKLKLAKLILIEAEGIKESQNINAIIALAEELTKDAVELATLVEEENRKVA